MVYQSLKSTPARLVSAFTRLISPACSLCHGSLTSDSMSSRHSLTGLCNHCINSLKRADHQCAICAQNLQSEQPICGHCLKKPPIFDFSIAACDYRHPINQAISAMKFEGQLHLIRGLSHILANTAQQKIQQQQRSLPDALVPIPLHPKRLRERGFNQSLLIAKMLSKHLQLPLLANRLVRVKHTPHQIGLKAIERRKNLHNAFAIQGALPQHIALIDDVITTGSTMNEACKALKNSGINTVEAWSLAKT